MRAGAPNVEALRALFTELEFTTLLKELLPVVEASEAHYTEASVRGRCRSGARKRSHYPILWQ